MPDKEKQTPHTEFAQKSTKKDRDYDKSKAIKETGITQQKKEGS